MQVIILLIIGLVAGVFSGMVGIGGGIIVIPALVYLLGFTQQQAQGTSLGLLLPPIGILAVMNYHKAGFVDTRAALIMCITFLAGSYLSSKFAISIPSEYLKKIFAVFMLVYAMKILISK